MITYEIWFKLVIEEILYRCSAFKIFICLLLSFITIPLDLIFLPLEIIAIIIFKVIWKED